MPWEETEEYIRSGHGSTDCDRMRTKTLDEERGIKAIICFKGESSSIQSYLFAKSKDWTMDKAKEWFDKHKEAPYGGDVTIDDKVGWLEDDIRTLWMKIDAISQRIDDLIATKFSMTTLGDLKASSKVVHVQSFKWQDGVASPCELTPCVQFKSYKWVPELKLPDWATGRLYLFSTLESPKAADNKVFDEAQKNRCAATMIGTPINIDHEIYDLVGQNTILDAEVEDKRMEGLCYVEDPTLNKLYDDGEIAGCSIEWFDKFVPPSPDGTINVAGTRCVGLGFITKSHLAKGYKLGDPLSSVKALENEVANLKQALNALTVKLVEHPIPDGSFAFVGDGERKLQIKTAEGKYDEALLKTAVADMKDLLPPAAVPDVKARLREGFAALNLPIPEEIAEVTRPLVAALDPKIAKKLQHSLDRRARYRERFHLWNKEEPE